MKKTATRIGSFLLMTALLAGFLPAMTVSASAFTIREKQEALVQTAWAYYDKGRPVQYDSVNLSVVSRKSRGAIRMTCEVPPEYATPDETLYTVCSDFCDQIIHDVFGFSLRGDPYFAVTGNIAKYDPATDPICAYVYDSSKSTLTIEQGLESVIERLQPGDMINGVKKTGNNGHAMFYVGDVLGDGTNYILHSMGRHYDTTTGEEVIECSPGKIKEIPNQIYASATTQRNDNAIALAPAREYLRKHYLTPNRKALRMSIIRTAGVLSDEEYPLSPSAQARLKFPRLVINRTATGMRFRDVEASSAVTLKIELTNKSKRAYTVPVKETVPAGVRFVKASDGAKVSGNEITWDVTLNAGETKTVSYDCAVTAKRGETVTFTGGSVSTIPSNTINIPIGGKHLTEAENTLIAEVASGKHKELFKNVPKSKLPAVVWNKLLKLNVPLPTPERLMEDLLERKSITAKTVCVLRNNLSGDAAIYRSMVIPEFYGGFRCAEQDPLKRVLDLRCDYLRPGDIVFEIDDINDPAKGQTLIYLGNEKFLKQVLFGGGASVATFFELQKAHTYQLFFAFRPTLAFDDVHDLPPLPEEKIFSKFSDVKENDWFYPYVKELVSDGVVRGVTETTFEPYRTLTYGQALKLIGLAVGENEPAKSASHWASGWLTLAKNKGWLAEDVNLDGTITRLALCRIAAKAAGLTKQPSKNPFKDTDDPDVLALKRAKVISGITEWEFKPNEDLNRAQISKIICALREIETP